MRDVCFWLIVDGDGEDVIVWGVDESGGSCGVERDGIEMDALSWFRVPGRVENVFGLMWWGRVVCDDGSGFWFLVGAMD